MALTGQLIRSLGIFTCGQHFHHHIQSQKPQHHSLVTHGIYRILRHPSYTGFYYWAIGLQLMMLNPVCVIAFARELYLFFSERIEYEEACLVQFYGEAYVRYRKSTSTLIPWIL